MKNNKNGFVVQGVVAIIALLIIGGGAYWMGMKKVSSPVDSIPSSQKVEENNTVYETQKISSQIVSVDVSISGLNEPLLSLSNNITILGQKYLYIRNSTDSIIAEINSESSSMPDFCVDNFRVLFEVTNPKVEGIKTFQGKPTVSVDVVKIISHEYLKRDCAY